MLTLRMSCGCSLVPETVAEIGYDMQNQQKNVPFKSIIEASTAGLCIVQDDRFHSVNRAIEEMTGYSQNELLERIGPLDLILPEYHEPIVASLRRLADGSLRHEKRSYGIQCRKKDGEIFDVMVSASVIDLHGRPAAVCTVVDISPMKKVEQQLRISEKQLATALEAKNVLLQEVYHRTKNNMLVIISMLALQRENLNDMQARGAFIDMENRIRAIAHVHEHLHRSENLADVNLQEYLEALVTTLVSSMNIDDRILVSVTSHGVSIAYDRAIPVGLVVNELVTNAMKHAFPDGGMGTIRILVTERNSGLVIRVVDDGCGFPVGYDLDSPASFGLQITANIIQRQLQGELMITSGDGTECTVVFPRCYLSG